MTRIALAQREQPMQPLALHSDNPHYFLWRGRPTVLITSGEHYGALLNLDFDYVKYFDELKAHGLNLTRTFSGAYREVPSSFGITDNTLAPKPQRYACPWARGSQPGSSDGGAKFDLTKWDAAYFERLKDFMHQARERGIVVEMKNSWAQPVLNEMAGQGAKKATRPAETERSPLAPPAVPRRA